MFKSYNTEHSSISEVRKDSQISFFDKGTKHSTEGTWKYFFQKYFETKFSLLWLQVQTGNTSNEKTFT